jgi:hypothetical protein
MGDGAQRITLVAAAACTAAALYGVPSWDLTDVRVLALLVAGATIVLLSVTRVAGTAGVAVERAVIALFLAGMPVVYVASGMAHGTGATWLAVELAGLLLYGGLAVAGWRHAPWLLAAGVAAHGLAWDAWHLVGPSYIPPWYAVGCLLVDVGVAAYVATRLGTWRETRAVSSRS